MRAEKGFEYIIGTYRESYIKAWRNRIKALGPDCNYNMKQQKLLYGFCLLTNKSFNYAIKYIARPCEEAIEKIKDYYHKRNMEKRVL